MLLTCLLTCWHLRVIWLPESRIIGLRKHCSNSLLIQKSSSRYTVFTLLNYILCHLPLLTAGVLLGCLCYIEVLLKLQLKCLILGVYTCFYLVGNWHIEAFQEIEEEEVIIYCIVESSDEPRCEIRFHG